MSLIEQFGGYEQANNKLLKMDKILKEVYYSPSDAQKANELRQAILEYRRQHNIFEVGDKVVFVSEKMDFLDDDQIHSISVITENNLPKVCGLYVSFEVIKHATDEEIKNNQRGS